MVSRIALSVGGGSISRSRRDRSGRAWKVEHRDVGVGVSASVTAPDRRFPAFATGLDPFVLEPSAVQPLTDDSGGHLRADWIGMMVSQGMVIVELRPPSPDESNRQGCRQCIETFRGIKQSAGPVPPLLAPTGAVGGARSQAVPGSFDFHEWPADLRSVAGIGATPVIVDSALRWRRASWRFGSRSLRADPVSLG